MLIVVEVNKALACPNCCVATHSNIRDLHYIAYEVGAPIIRQFPTFCRYTDVQTQH